MLHATGRPCLQGLIGNFRRGGARNAEGLGAGCSREQMKRASADAGGDIPCWLGRVDLDFDLDLTCVVTLWELELAFWANFHMRNW